MGSWLAKLAGQEDNAAKILKNPHSIAAYTLVFGLAFLVLLLWFVIIIVTAIRIFKKYIRKEAPLKTTLDLQVGKRVLNNVRRRISTHDRQAGEFQMVELNAKPGPASPRQRSTDLGIRLIGGNESSYIEGDPGICVDNVRPGSVADGKLFPGDRIVAVNDFRMDNVSLKYAKEVMLALRQAEGHLKLCIKRAPLREQRVNEAFSLYCDDEETGKRQVVFSKEHMEVFEEAFSIFDARGSGKIPRKRFFPLLRTLGYNIHQAEAFEYINELDLTEKPTITFNELIKILEHVVAGQTAKIEIQCVYNVFDQERKGHVPVNELIEALERLYEKKLAAEELQEILFLADLDKDGSVKEEDFERLLLPSLMLY
ncbi:uncharacterized protein [Montipora capricornis]|uniref:uncharacterized protein n=1 Tax=Montipora capricornis TaxID=246305 RepID=UPI0035F114C9